jgi:hypothetical protein
MKPKWMKNMKAPSEKNGTATFRNILLYPGISFIAQNLKFRSINIF